MALVRETGGRGGGAGRGAKGELGVKGRGMGLGPMLLLDDVGVAEEAVGTAGRGAKGFVGLFIAVVRAYPAGFGGGWQVKNEGG